MLFRQLAAILGGGLSLAAAGPLSPADRDSPSEARRDTVVRREVPSSHVVHERQLPQWSQKWKRAAKVPRDALLPMRIGLKQRNLDEGAALLRDISNPKSPRYGKHLKRDEVVEMFAPPQSSIDAVSLNPVHAPDSQVAPEEIPVG